MFNITYNDIVIPSDAPVKFDLSVSWIVSGTFLLFAILLIMYIIVTCIRNTCDGNGTVNVEDELETVERPLDSFELTVMNNNQQITN